MAPANELIFVGSTGKLSATVKDSEGATMAGATLSWTSRDDSVATIDSNGLAQGIKPGVTQIFASGGGVTAAATIEVLLPPKRPSEVVDVEPGEGQLVPLTLACSKSIPRCEMPIFSAVGVGFAFQGEDIFESARLFVDGKDVTADSTINSSGQNWIDGGVQVCTPGGECGTVHGAEGGIAWMHILELPVGFHQIHVEGRSHDGKVIPYDWKFSVTP